MTDETHFYGDGCTPPHLPTREEAERFAGGLMEILVHGKMLDVSVLDAPAYAAVLRGSVKLLEEIADGTLKTREEFVDSLDMEAAIERYLVCVGGKDYLLCAGSDGRAWHGNKARSVVAAALGESS